MHGNKSSPEIPIFGNKVIAVSNGIIDLHGIPRTPTWTSLKTSAAAGDSQITLLDTPVVDWQVGEQIVIAPTNYFNNETETRTITAISG